MLQYRSRSTSGPDHSCVVRHGKHCYELPILQGSPLGRETQGSHLACWVRAAREGTARERWEPQLHRHGSAPWPRPQAQGLQGTLSAAAPQACSRCWTSRTSARLPAPCTMTAVIRQCTLTALKITRSLCSAKSISSSFGGSALPGASPIKPQGLSWLLDPAHPNSP